ncbi:MAG TPA: methylated-DNA--[protein]-cysteine S-methyltransferase [Kiloniellales bacterium]|nr:methylated-DNA--[protein]-cysteine S-methyltransferase [Kiloniellales bacterium]
MQLPDVDVSRFRSSLARAAPDAVETRPPAAVQEWIAAICGLLQGEARDLLEVQLDMAGVPDFARHVYDLARQIRPGQTCTYGELARLTGKAGAARAVGRALGQNPWPLVVPCHRVLAAGGRAGGFSAPGGVSTKLRLLQIEGARPRPDPDLFGAAGLSL